VLMIVFLRFPLLLIFFTPHRDLTKHSFLALDPHGFHRVAYNEWGDPRVAVKRRINVLHGVLRSFGW
jgi:hypothetical protein